jgi:Uma2 family endonuclease
MSQLMNVPFHAEVSLRRFSVEEYHDLIARGTLTDDDRVELLEGYLVYKMAKNPPHETAIRILNRLLLQALPQGWILSSQSPITLDDSEPEPDFSIVRGTEQLYADRHPGAEDVGLVIEVSDSSLARDRVDKARIYARAGLPVYWVVNLMDRQVEVYTDPGTESGGPGYAQQRIYAMGAEVPLELDGGAIAMLATEQFLGATP